MNATRTAVITLVFIAAMFAQALAQEPATKPVKAGDEILLVTVDNKFVIDTTLSTHRLTIQDERGVVLAVDGEQGERAIKALNKWHTEALRSTMEQAAIREGHYRVSLSLVLDVAKLYVDLAADLAESDHRASKILGKPTDAYTTFRVRVAETRTQLAAIAAILRKDRP